METIAEAQSFGPVFTIASLIVKNAVINNQAKTLFICEVVDGINNPVCCITVNNKK